LRSGSIWKMKRMGPLYIINGFAHLDAPFLTRCPNLLTILLSQLPFLFHSLSPFSALISCLQHVFLISAPLLPIPSPPTHTPVCFDKLPVSLDVACALLILLDVTTCNFRVVRLFWSLHSACTSPQNRFVSLADESTGHGEHEVPSRSDCGPTRRTSYSRSSTNVTLLAF